MNRAERLVANGVLVFVWLCLVAPKALGQGGQVAESPERKAVLDRLQALSVLPPAEWRFHTGDLPGGQSLSLDDSGWPVVKEGFRWETGAAWFRRTLEIPARLNGYDLSGATLRLDFRTGSSGDFPIIVYVNDARVAMGADLEPVVVAERVQPAQKIQVAVKVLGPPQPDRFNRAAISVEMPPGRPDPNILRQELLADEVLVGKLAPDQARSQAEIDAAFKAVDFAALDRGDQAAFDASLRRAQAHLDAFGPLLRKYSVHAVGNSHIDMAWLWPWSETVEVVRDTFRTSLQLMNEYPDYTFAQSSAQADAWLEEKYPQIFEQIKRRVAEGRWELVGGMWVEPDLNMPSGESQVRQLLVGKRYFKEKFGKDVRIGWNPDSFGYNWQLPQIYKKSGVDYFVTQKIAWNDTTQFPYKLFWWEAPEGSRVLTYFPDDYVNLIDPVKMARSLADYASRIPDFTELMHLYGVGDHGGGPTRVMLDRAHRWQDPKLPYPRLFLGTAQGFFDELAKKVPAMNLPVWRSELYLQYHRGVFTTQAETKKHDRQSEGLLLNAEKFSALASLAGQPYPGDMLNYAWKKVLFNQFHDVAAGSGIAAVYRDADRDYVEVAHIGGGALHHSLEALAAYANTQGPGSAVLVVNPLAWTRSDVVEADVQLARPAANVEVRDAKGQPVLAEVAARTPETQTFRIYFLARDVPSLGWAVFHVVPVAKAAEVPSALAARESENAYELENEFLRVRVDRKTGCVTSLFDKVSRTEALEAGACGNLLQTFVDKPKDWDAWNIDADFENHKWDLLDAQEVKLVERGPLRAVVRVTRKFQNSTFVQNIVLAAGVDHVDVPMDVDWHEKHILLKVAFALSAHNERATFEIPYGSIERPTTRNTPEERAQFEVPALRWADLSDAAHGFSLLNDSKYGYDAKGNVLRLSLLRSPAWPDPHADEGRHHFTYALYPHGGTWRQAATVRRARELNYPLIALAVASHEGALPAQYSFARVEPENVVLTALKKAEDDDGLIFRFYEWAGREADVTIHLPPGAERASETSLMEQPGAPLEVHDSAVVVHTKPYEIKTVKVLFGPASPARFARPEH